MDSKAVGLTEQLVYELLTGNLTTGDSYCLLLELFQPNVTKFDLHGFTGVDLQSDEALHSSASRIVVNQHTHHSTIIDLYQSVTPGNNVDFIPVVGLYDLSQCIRSTQ